MSNELSPGNVLILGQRDVRALLTMRACWNQTDRDIIRMVGLDKKGSFVARLRGDGFDIPVGTSSVLPLGRNNTWIGMILVHPEIRRQGVANAMMQACVKYAIDQGKIINGLDATPMGNTVYGAVGYVNSYRIWRSCYQLAEFAEAQYDADRVKVMTAADLDTVIRYDAAAFLERENIMRRLVSVMTTSTDQNIPFEDDYGEAFWVGEEKPVTESNVQLSLKNIGSHKLSTLIKVSEELLQDAAFDVEGYIARVFARRYGRKEESAILTGNGIGKPRGITLDATTGVTTAANNAITSDEIIDLYHSLARYFRSNARFIMADSTVKVIRKLKSALTGDYMWQPGLQAGQPDMLLGKVVEVSDDVDAIAATKKVILFGDYREYQLVDRRNAYLQRLSELYAVNGQVGFRGYKRLDGRLLRSDAVKMLVMKA